MKIALVTLALNEMEWIPRLWQQHKDWPELAAWVFVEAADREYARANPGMTTPEGFSIDGTMSFLGRLAHDGVKSTKRGARLVLPIRIAMLNGIVQIGGDNVIRQLQA